MEQEILEAQARLLKKREELKATDYHTPSIMSFRDFIPQCIHGLKVDVRCEECEVDKKTEVKKEETEREWDKKNREEQRKDSEHQKQQHELHPELFMGFIPAKFRKNSLDNFVGSEEIKKILREYGDGFIRNTKYLGGKAFFDEGLVQYPGSILFTGKTGCGKTHLAVSIITELVKRNFYIRECCFVTAPELLLEIRATFRPSYKKYDDFGKCEADTENDVLDKYSKCELLILDDLGAEKVSDFTIQSLYLVIDRRNKNLKPTIVTTNLSLEEIETLIDARMASRLADMKVIKLTMPDYRKKR